MTKKPPTSIDTSSCTLMPWLLVASCAMTSIHAAHPFWLATNFLLVIAHLTLSALHPHRKRPAPRASAPLMFAAAALCLLTPLHRPTGAVIAIALTYQLIRQELQHTTTAASRT
ncbi:hypothetical protein [Dermatophilus congolensis]|uniref:Uncharacterized protein n=1 Tax=Dermatophilus congolensis TaxID=1863 RepID=A0A239VT90_9MICO|nr:hypothetical protein [Dermatophilus congolensis]MBO3129925.1 hypothetical protein [Dermatophilus congolensis]MBO3131445.1 hypothetical protein [Dermatophilus congolensis]MBO3134399.1 hypothetical protein [Dermatophilus congolensis]MBO3136634.1 hypothetical protein [Dermatophilus congolensis]MBO3138878.1 hypothetical protein [Dermatophilus congolensis]